MAGPKISWLRREFDYWKYCINERILTLLSLVFLLVGLIGLTPLGPNFNFRDIINYACFLGSIVLIITDDLTWKQKIKKMKVLDLNIRNFQKVKNVQVYGGRPFIILEDVNKAIRNRQFKHKQINITGTYELHTDARENAIMFLEYFRLGYSHGIPGKQVKMWNDTKIRLHSSVEDLLNKNVQVELKKTNYFDYLGTAYFSFRECLYRNKLFYDGESLLKNYKSEFVSIRDAKTAHHIGVNALFITNDKQILYQVTKARATRDNQAPSASGSLDFKDVDLMSFEESLLNGVLREFAEETGWNEIAMHGKNAKLEIVESMFYWPLGMSIDLSRGMVSDFFFVIIAEKDSHEEYYSYYRDGKVELDRDELEPQNSIRFKPIDTTCIETLKESINNFKNENLHSNAILSLSLDFLLKAVEEEDILREKILKL